MDNETHWDAMRRDRKYLPQQMTGDRDTVGNTLEAIIAARGLSGRVEVMTDQIDVYVGKRKVAIYMP